jgi:hypothetical protein
MDMNQRQIALGIARARAINGLVMMLAPQLPGRAMFGKAADSPIIRMLLRLVGVRDLVLGIGAITTLKEKTMDAEWVGMGAVADGVDAGVALVTPGLPVRSRGVALAGASAAFSGLMAARALADERTPKLSEIDS